jgi:hypothetical protein
VDIERAMFSGPGSLVSLVEEPMGRDQEGLLDTADTSGLAMKLSLPLSKAGFKPDDVDATANGAVRLPGGVSSYPAPP